MWSVTKCAILNQLGEEERKNDGRWPTYEISEAVHDVKREPRQMFEIRSLFNSWVLFPFGIDCCVWSRHFLLYNRYLNRSKQRVAVANVRKNVYRTLPHLSKCRRPNMPILTGHHLFMLMLLLKGVEFGKRRCTWIHIEKTRTRSRRSSTEYALSLICLKTTGNGEGVKTLRETVISFKFPSQWKNL